MTDTLKRSVLYLE